MLLDDGLLEYVSFPVLGFWRERLVVVCSKKKDSRRKYISVLLVIDYSASRAVTEGWTIPYIVNCVHTIPVWSSLYDMYCTSIVTRTCIRRIQMDLLSLI